MPKYLFRCSVCGEEEVVEAETGSAAEVPLCCDKPMLRVWNTSVSFRGGGWTRRPNDEIPSMDLPERRRQR
jgi:predicted nucleic acid-binding Zn ribbon protein